MRITRYSLLHGLRAAALRERGRRATAAEIRREEELTRLFAKLDEMAARLRAAPDWREPTPEEQARNIAALEAWFEANGYSVA